MSVNSGIKVLVLCFLVHSVTAQEPLMNDEDATSIDKYVRSIVPGEYEIRFKAVDSRNSFKLLREFLKEKENLLQALILRFEYYDLDSSSIQKERLRRDKLLQSINGKNNDDTVSVKLRHFYANYFNTFRKSFDLNPDSVIKRRVSEVYEKIEEVNADIVESNRAIFESSNLEKNIAIVKDDIFKCSSQIDSALAPEYQQQDFRKTISIVFSVLIGLLLCIFFFIVFKRSDGGLSKELLSGNGLQFITLFVLIIAVILFGILNILGSSELAAILSGISGYILGKGTQKDISSAIEVREKIKSTENSGSI